MKRICSILVILICANLLACSGESQKERKLFERIKPGMEAAEVFEILGQPDEIIQSFDSTTSSAYFFTKSKSGIRSQMPVVVFDSSTKVTSSTYGE